MAWPLVVAAIAGALGGGGSAYLQQQSENDRINAMIDESRSMRDFFSKKSSQYVGSAESALQEARGFLMNRNVLTEGKMQEFFGQQNSTLDEFLNQQSGQYTDTIERTLKAARRQASGSGLYGGLQESSISSDTISQAMQAFLGNVLSAKMGVQQNQMATWLGNNSQYTSNLANVYGNKASLYGNLAGAATSGQYQAWNALVSAQGQGGQINPWAAGLFGAFGGLSQGIQAGYGLQKMMQQNQGSGYGTK